MAKKKKTEKKETDITELLKYAHISSAGDIIDQQIVDALEVNYMPYAMSVILSRAIPEIDGLKPSHRKLLYTMYKMNLLNGARTKSANIVGQTMRLNPHGDASIYETMVRLARGNEALLHPYIDSKGNFGKAYSRDMAYAASRYTEVKLSPICAEIFADIDKDTVEFVDNSPYIPICVLMRRNRNDILFLCRPYKRGSVMDRFEEQYKEELKSKYLGYLLAYTANVSGKYAKGSDDILDLINRSKEDSYISSLNISMLKSFNLDFSKEAGGKYAHQAQFLKYLLDKSDSYDFDVDSVFAQMLNGVDISSYDEGALKTIKAQIITEIEHYQDAVRDKDYAGDINFEGNKLVGDLMAMQSIAGNAEVMKRSTSFSPDNFDIPSEYYDYSPLNNVVDNMMIGGFNTSDYMYSQITDLFQRNPEAIRTFPLEAKEKSSFCKLLMEKKKKMPDNSKIQEYLSDVSQKMGVSESDVLGYYDMYYSKERKKGDYSKQMIQYLMQTHMNEMNMNNNANLEDSGPVM